jgi:hypothetical protein
VSGSELMVESQPKRWLFYLTPAFSSKRLTFSLFLLFLMVPVVKLKVRKSARLSSI